MKKLGLAFIILVVATIIYYFTTGSGQIVDEIKKEVNQELTQLKQSGFSIEDRKITENSEHFVVDFNDTKKITTYLQEQGSVVSEQDVLLLKGLKVGVDMTYLPTAKNAVSMDIYPLSLPTNLGEELGIADSKVIQSIEQMIKEKLFLAHVNINKLLSGFDGYIQDIDSVIKGDEQNGHLLLKNFTVKGELKENRVVSSTDNIELLSFTVEHQLKVALNGMKTNTTNSDNAKDTNIDYSIKSLEMSVNNDKSLALIASNLSGLSKDKINGNLLDNKSQFKIETVDLKVENEKHVLKNIQMDTLIKNMNIKAFEKLENLSSENENEENIIPKLIPTLQEITQSDLSMDVSKLSIESISRDGKIFDGFNLSAMLKTNKNFDWKSVESNPMMLMQVADIKSNLTISNEIFTMMSQDPKMMMIMILAKPIDKNGKKVYDIEFSKGSLKVNGKPFM